MKRIVAIGELFFSFQGRISRQMWWVAMPAAIFFMTLVAIPLRYLVFPQIENPDIKVLLYFLSLFLGTWISLPRDVKRLHDRNHSGKKKE